MAKITRKTAKIFASNAGGTGVSEFGAIADGAANYTTDPDVIQNSDFEAGWLNAVLAGSKRLPPYEDMNAVLNVISRQIAYNLQEGIPEYDSSTEYHQNSIVKKAGTYELYGSLINTNTGNALPSQVDDANWKYLGELGNASIQTDQVSKGWVNFSGSGTVSIRSSYNVTSVTDNGTGDYTIVWDTDFADTDYCVVIGSTQSFIELGTIAVGSAQVLAYDSAHNAGDAAIVCVAAFAN